MSSTASSRAVIPAQLAFLAIYNPAFGEAEGSEYEQIFYYYSRATDDDGRRSKSASSQAQSKTANKEDEKNDRLRQVGLARGMIEFAK